MSACIYKRGSNNRGCSVASFMHAFIHVILDCIAHAGIIIDCMSMPILLYAIHSLSNCL